MDNGKLKATIDLDPSQVELSLLFVLRKQTILNHIVHNDKVKKLDQWVLYEHNDNQKLNSVRNNIVWKPALYYFFITKMNNMRSKTDPVRQP